MLDIIMNLKYGLEVTQGYWNWYHSNAWLGFLLAFHSNYGTILYRLQDIATYWSKIAQFLYPTCIQRPRRGEPVGISWRCLILIKREWLGYCGWRNCESTCTLSRFDRIPERNRRTDRQNCYINIVHQCADARSKFVPNKQHTGTKYESKTRN